MAYKIIVGLNLEQYYQRYAELSGKAPSAVDTFDNQLDYIGQISQENGVCSLNLVVDGLHCGACVWVIESSMRKQERVMSARVNLTTRRLLLEWRGEKEDITEFVGFVQRLGYRLTPYDPILYDEQEQLAQRQMLKRLAVSGFGFLQAMMTTIAVWAGHWSAEASPYTQHIMHLITVMISVPCIIYSVQPFIKSAYMAISNRRSNMDCSIVLAIMITMIISLIEAFCNNSYTYFDSVLMLIFFLLIGRYIDLKIRNKVGTQAKRLLLNQPQTAMVERKSKLILMHISKVNVGDIVRITVGEKVPLDGVVIDGDSFMDSSIITGETIPHPVHPGDQIYAGSLNIDGPLSIRVSKLSDNSLLAEMMRLIDIASRQQSKFVRIADRVASFYTPAVMVLSVSTFCYWYAIGATAHLALVNAAAVLLITCPCALALAVPAVYIIATSNLIQQGIMLKNIDALERLTQINSVYLDKTGTITYGKPEWLNKDDFSEEDRMLLKTLSGYSKHPLCLCVQRTLCEMEGVEGLFGVEEMPGQGMQALYAGRRVALGSRKMLNIAERVDDDYMEMWLNLHDVSKRLIFKDVVRPEVKDVVTELKKLNLDVALISGDRLEIVRTVAAAAGIAKYYGNLLPKQKYEVIEKEQLSGNKILMMGDGLNDSAVMKMAHCSMSPSGAIDLTRSVADIVYPGSLEALPYVLKISRDSRKLVQQNLAFSLAYNVVMIPFAATGYITPAIAALFMSISSVTVVLNAMRLIRR